jgi:hypothetical protein
VDCPESEVEVSIRLEAWARPQVSPIFQTPSLQ